MNEDGPRYKPVWDPDQRCWTARKIQDIEHDEQYKRYIDAIQEVVRENAVFERLLTESAHKKLSTRRIRSSLYRQRSATKKALENFPLWLMEAETNDAT